MQRWHSYPFALIDQSDNCSQGCRAGLSFDPPATPVGLTGCLLLFDCTSFTEREVHSCLTQGTSEAWMETAVHTWYTGLPGRHTRWVAFCQAALMVEK